MKDILGSPGTVGSLVLRTGQFLLAAASAAFMITATGFSAYTAFCYLTASMGLQVIWSLGLACLDAYALRIKKSLQNPFLVSLLVVGDWVTATLSLAAACSSAGVTILFAWDINRCNDNNQPMPCLNFQLSIALAFATWFLIALSSLVMFWLLASV